MRTIFFVTCGQKPDWLNISHSKIRFITHKDFIPPEYLPTFCSDVIELNLWRIKGLSEHFIYFNDDVFLNRLVVKEDFFENGEPKIAAIARPLYLYGKMYAFERRWVNDYAVINKAFNVRKAIQIVPEKWFSYKIKDKAKYNRRIFDDNYIIGMANAHVVIPFIKEAFESMWQEQFSILDETCKTKFRTSEDVTVRLPVLWTIFQGRFSPVIGTYYGNSINLSVQCKTLGVSGR